MAGVVRDEYTNSFLSSLHGATDLPDHLFHSGGSASIHCPTVVDAHVPSLFYGFFADGADHMTIPTCVDLHWWNHSFEANWALRHQAAERVIAVTPLTHHSFLLHCCQFSFTPCFMSFKLLLQFIQSINGFLKPIFMPLPSNS